ncbi:MAG: SIS domain-containing protein [Acidobacteriia bacterium]|nr:SIS domain-containing protein [Terriglobia bacterium]
MTNSNSIIEGGYLRDILAQPEALRDTLAALAGSAALERTAERFESGGFERIVLTGMGGSYWALHPLHLDLLRQGRAALLIETSELIHCLPSLLDSGTLVIAASQSGRSAEILRMMEVKPPDCCMLAVTNTPDSPLALQADAVVATRAGAEFTVSCKTYVTALMALKWLADLLAGRRLRQSRDELAQAAPAVEGYLGSWRDHVRSAASELTGVRRLFFLGRGSSLAAAGTGGLITKESAHFHAEGMSAAAFRHGPLEMIDAALYALVFAGDPATAPLNRRLAQEIIRAGGHAAVTGEDAEPGVFRLPKVHPSVRPIVEILPVQMMTVALGALAGREAGRFERATKVTADE